MLSRDLLKKYIIERMGQTTNKDFEVNSKDVNSIRYQIKQYHEHEGAYQELIKLLVELDNCEFDE